MTILREAQSWGSSLVFMTVLPAQFTNQGSFLPYALHCSLVPQLASHVNHISREISQKVNPRPVLSLLKKRGFCLPFTSCTEDEGLNTLHWNAAESPSWTCCQPGSSLRRKVWKPLFQRDLCGGEPITYHLQTWSCSAHSVRAGGGSPAQGWLTFPAGLHQAVPLPTTVTQQGKGAFTVAHDMARGTHVQQLIPHLQAGMSLQDGVWEWRWISTWLLWGEGITVSYFKVCRTFAAWEKTENNSPPEWVPSAPWTGITGTVSLSPWHPQVLAECLPQMRHSKTFWMNKCAFKM